MKIPLEKILQVAFLTPMDDPSDPKCHWGAPVLLWGSPGIGKSQRIRAAASSLGLPFEVAYAATKQPEDAGSILIADGQGGVTSVCALPQVRRLLDEEAGVLCIDELSCAAPAVQAAFLSLFLDGHVGDTSLPPRVRRVAAANPPEEAAGGWELEPPMANRMLHFNVPVPEGRDWADWLLDIDQESLGLIEKGEAMVTENWPAAWERTRVLLKGFMETRGPLLFKLPEQGDVARSRAWASPRSWFLGSRAYATCLATKNSSLAGLFLTAAIGEGAANEFLTWVRAADLPTSEDVLLKGWEPDKKRLDRSLAVYSGLTLFIRGIASDAEKRKYGRLAWQRLDEAQTAGFTDMTVLLAQALLAARMDKTLDPAIEPFSTKTLAKLAKDGHHKHLRV